MDWSNLSATWTAQQAALRTAAEDWRARIQVWVEDCRARFQAWQAQRLQDKKLAEEAQMRKMAVRVVGEYRWIPWKQIQEKVLPHVPREQQAVFIEALIDLRYNLMQPDQATANREGALARQKQYRKIAGGRTAQPMWMVVAGGGAGLMVGGILGLSVPPDMLFGLPPMIVTGLLGLPIGAYGSRFLVGMDAYRQGMMLVIVNERCSVIAPQKVTEQVRIWIPKALLAWRAHQWRYANRRPYMWLHLPIGERLHDEPRNTISYLALANDLHVAHNAAVYAQRTRNRDISNNAVDFADVDAGEDAGNEMLERLLPYAPVPIMVIGGILLTVLTT